MNEHICLRLDPLTYLVEQPSALRSNVLHSIAHNFVCDFVVLMGCIIVLQKAFSHLFLSIHCNFLTKLLAPKTSPVVVLY